MNSSSFMWIVFGVTIVAALAVDIGIFHRKASRVTAKSALIETLAWIALSLIFAAWVYFSRGRQAGLEFLTGYVIEKSLSIDNILVFLLIFQALRVPGELQHRVLYSGVIGALVMRGLFVFAGVALLRHFHPVVFVFGAILLAAGVRMLLPGARQMQPERNWVVRTLSRVLHVSHEFNGRHFWFKERGRWRATPLLLALIAVEVMDVVFAVDSVPAVLAVTRDSFIAYSSNAFAILGLRAMYFALVSVLPRLRFLEAGLAALLIFVGAKMVLPERMQISTEISLAIIAVIMAIAVGASMLRPKAER
ncbi:MAG TPA: TerC/Alx family metal homeostasis membrane protein [Candidatus Acidoferrales bacterium]|nr:TerC/Alx family metal homeostasis membrane protein [Candidatus Acidoferrales bacterium]